MNVGKKLFKILRYPEGNFSWIGSDVIPLRGNRVRINIVDYDLTPEIQAVVNDTK